MSKRAKSVLSMLPNQLSKNDIGLYIPKKKPNRGGEGGGRVEDMDFPRGIEEEVSRNSLGGLIKNNVEFSVVI